MAPCPFCGGKMVSRPARVMVRLLLPEHNALAKMLAGGTDSARGLWYQCQECRYVALFEKKPTE